MTGHPVPDNVGHVHRPDRTDNNPPIGVVRPVVQSSEITHPQPASARLARVGKRWKLPRITEPLSINQGMQPGTHRAWDRPKKPASQGMHA